jgi:FkbM family methyltransferase
MPGLPWNAHARRWPRPEPVNELLKRLTSGLPRSWQQELRRLKCRHEIQHRTFRSYEPEFLILDSLLSAGDWVIDVGANVGHYTKRFSDLVGPSGRVIAVEPVTETFALVSANALLFQHGNVTLLNVAASDHSGVAGMEVSRFETGLSNYYQARLSEGSTDRHVLTVRLDALALPHPIRLMKIDAEGHDPAVLRGAEALLARDHPTLIVETGSSEVVEHLRQFGYTSEKLPGSPNALFRWLPG